MITRPAKSFLNLSAAAIHLQVSINTDSLLRWDVKQASQIAFRQDFFDQFSVFSTRLRKIGQSPTVATNSSPARIAPTPEGVPVRIKSPGRRVRDWLAKEMISEIE